jgi:hypothetical protein
MDIKKLIEDLQATGAIAPPEAFDESPDTKKWLDDIMRRENRQTDNRRSKQKAFLGNLAPYVAILLAIGPVYYALFSGWPRSPAPGAAVVQSAQNPTALLARLILAEDIQRRERSRLDAASVGGPYARYLLASGAIAQEEMKSADRIRYAVATGQSDLRFEEVVALYGIELLHGKGASDGPVLPVNGDQYPAERAQDSRQIAAYLYAELAARRLRDLLNVPHDSNAGANARLVVRVEPDASNLGSGEVRFAVVNSRTGAVESTESRRFVGSLAPISFRQCFPEADHLRGASISSGQTAEEIVMTFTATESPTSSASLVRHNGLELLSEVFGSDKKIEVYFETKADFTGSGPLPTVQFATGGTDVVQTSLPPQPVSTQWTTVVIPVDLVGSSRWHEGLTVTVTGLSRGAPVTLRIRNAYIRVLGDRAQSKTAPGTA